MADYQLPPLKNEQQFEHLIMDLFNSLQNTNTYQNTDFQTFGVRGQDQKGIDIYSTQTHTVIQCKVKDVRKKDDAIRKELIADIVADLEKSKALAFDFKFFIIASTFRDDRQIQEFLLGYAGENKFPFTLQYWGWDTISNYVIRHEAILQRHFPKFMPKPSKERKPSVQLPEGALGLDLNKKNYINYLSKRYGDWKQQQLDRDGKEGKFNWASHYKSLMNRYHAAGINYIPVIYFDDLVAYLSDKIDKTAFGRNQKAKGRRSYSTFEEHIAGITINND